MTTYIIDIAIFLALAFFAWRGAKRGLILTLFSLLAIFVAFFGARAVASTFSQPVADILRPSIQQSINGVLTGQTPGALPSPGPEGSPSPAPEDGTEPEPDFTLQEVLDLIGEEAVEEQVLEVTTTAAAAVAAYLAQLAANALLFGLSFLLILLVWFLISRALDLTFRLPILSAVNTIGGLLIGLLKGVLLMLVVVWLARLCGLITDANAGPLARLMTIEGLSGMLRSMMAG